MKKSKLILSEGYKKIVITFAISIFLLLFISDCLGYIGLIVGIFMVYIYRDIPRHIFENTQNVLAPIDSVVTAIDTVNDKQKIYCKVNLCNNHVFRAPIAAEVKMKKYMRGLNLDPNSYKASLYNEQMVLKFNDMKIKLISGLCNTKMKRIKEGPISQGEKISVFLDGLVIITVDKNTKLMVNIGDKLTSGQSILFKK